MKGRQLKFILLLCTLAVLAYLAGEILLLFVFDNNNIWVSRGWLIAVYGNAPGIRINTKENDLCRFRFILTDRRAPPG